MNVVEQSNNKADIIEKELIKSKLSLQDLRTDVERVCLEYEKFQNKYLKDELFRVMLHSLTELTSLATFFRLLTMPNFLSKKSLTLFLYSNVYIKAKTPVDGVGRFITYYS